MCIDNVVPLQAAAKNKLYHSLWQGLGDPARTQSSCAACTECADFSSCKRLGVPPTCAHMRVCCRSADLMLLEVDAEVQEFVTCLKDWDIKW
jgi:hypothetical protein